MLGLRIVSMTENSSVAHSCKSGRAFRVGFGSKVDKILGLIRA